MKAKFFLSFLALVLIISAFSQKPTMELTFTAENNGQYVPLDSIFIKNLTQGGDTTLYAPDTVLMLYYITAIGENNGMTENSFSVSQNYPNPFKGKTTVNLYLPEKEHIKITIRDILGRELAQYKNTLNRGNHSLFFYPGNEKYYIFSAKTSRETKTIKMANLNAGGQVHCKLVYNGQDGTSMNFKSEKAITDFVFSPGDELLFVGYSYSGESGMIDSPSVNQTYTFQYATNIPCPGTPTVTYEGQVYNTIQIFSQCWLKENLNVGAMIPGIDEMEDNDTIEKYCYDDDPANCDTYGGLYQWDEMMQYTITQGVQGICPPGWHIPTDEEWKALEGVVDSQYGIGDPVWDLVNLRGFDAGLNLKSTSGWSSGGNGSDLYGFSGLPGGSRNSSGNFLTMGYHEDLWTSTETPMYRNLRYNSEKVHRNHYDDRSGFSVRCVKD